MCRRPLSHPLSAVWASGWGARLAWVEALECEGNAQAAEFNLRDDNGLSGTEQFVAKGRR